MAAAAVGVASSTHARVAQSAEQLTRNEQVRSSILLSGSTRSRPIEASGSIGSTKRRRSAEGPASAAPRRWGSRGRPRPVPGRVSVHQVDGAQGGRGVARGRGRDADPQRAGQDAELQRRVEQQGLAVDAGLDRRPDSTVNGRCAHSVHPLNRSRRPADSAATKAATSPAPLTSAAATPSVPVSRRARLPNPASDSAVGVVRDLDDLGAVLAGAVGTDEVQVERLGVGTEQVGQHRRGRLALGVAVLGRTGRSWRRRRATRC